ncbi:MAG: ATP phosphoribosyltransferase regulatory subunit, partial [Clostridia bacterium]
MYNKYKLPQGVLDYLPTECYAKNNIERLMMDTFCGYGYNQIESPILERYALFENGVGKVSLSNLFKVSDIDGDLLVLRPDMTMPTSRIVATKLDGGAHKLCYLGKSFSMLEKNMLREFTQVGIEYMGEASVNA